MKDPQIIIEAGKQDITIIREYNAPRTRVFRAYIDPELYMQWVHPANEKMKMDYFSAKSGGTWRYIITDKDGNESAFHGVNHEVKYPERIVGTFEFERTRGPNNVILETVTFEQVSPNKTKVTSKSVFQSVQDRDAMAQSGIEMEIIESQRRLSKLLKGMRDIT